jgi:hypothetical protein
MNIIYINRRIITAILVVICFANANGQVPYLPAPYSNLPTTHNFVRSYTVLKPGLTSSGVLTSTDPREVQLTTQYLDGLGRPIQTVNRKGSLNTSIGETLAKDLVAPQTYDVFGREAYQFLPYVSSGNDGNFSGGVGDAGNPFKQQKLFYESPASPIVGQGDFYYYSKTNFEPSPLNRVTEQYAPGNSWVGSETNVKRSIKSGYFFNTALDAVRIWNVNDNATLGVFKTYASPTGTAGIYPAGQLYKTITTDEHGKQVIEFKDKQGQVILKKVQIHNVTDGGLGADHNPLHWICTYYIYDDFGSLRCVVQPEGVKWLHFNSWNLSNATILAEQCFRYEYDERRRMSMKKVPGAEPVYMVYDKRDRLILTQDGNMRGQNNWLYTWYDELNRPVASGLWTTTDIFATQRSNAAVQPGTIYKYYPFSGTAGLDELTRTFYDDYSWLTAYSGLGLTTVCETEAGISTAENNTTYPYVRQLKESAAVKGMVTGNRTKILGTSDWITSLMVYDANGKVIQTKSHNSQESITERTTMQYGFAGQVHLSVTRQIKTGAAAQTTVIQSLNEYDEIGRVKTILKRQSHTSIASGTLSPAKVISVIKYDALGQIKTKDIGRKGSTNVPLETLKYDYNIRGWLLGVNRNFVTSANTGAPDAGKWFGFDLGYDKPTNASGQAYSNMPARLHW